MSELAAATPLWAVGIIIGILGLIVSVVRLTFKTGEWVGSINTSIANFKDTVTLIREDTKGSAREIKEAMTKVQEGIISLLKEFASKTLNPGSPLEPNELGKKSF